MCVCVWGWGGWFDRTESSARVVLKRNLCRSLLAVDRVWAGERVRGEVKGSCTVLVVIECRAKWLAAELGWGGVGGRAEHSTSIMPASKSMSERTAGGGGGGARRRLRPVITPRYNTAVHQHTDTRRQTGGGMKRDTAPSVDVTNSPAVCSRPGTVRYTFVLAAAGVM